MPDGNTWEVPVGLDADFDVLPYDSAGLPVRYEGTETLTCQVWSGDDSTPDAGVVTAAWSTLEADDDLYAEWGDRPLIRASVVGAATAAIGSGFRLVRISIVSGAKTTEVHRGWLKLTDSPGSATAPTTWCGLQDMLDVAGDWLETLLTDSGRTDFLADRARATTELRNVILARWPSARLAIDLGSYDGSYYYEDSGRDAPNPWLANLLDSGGLLIDDAIRSAVACLAVSFACQRSLTWEPDDVYARRAAHFQRRWRSALPGLTIAIDTNDDGTAELWIPLHSFSSRC